MPAGVLVHGLRHTFATSALEAGADVVELQTLVCHASLDTTRRHFDATAEGLREVGARASRPVALRNISADRGPDLTPRPSLHAGCHAVATWGVICDWSLS